LPLPKKIWPTLFRNRAINGRFQQVASSPELYSIDVAHNPEAAVELARRVSHFSRQPVCRVWQC